MTDEELQQLFVLDAGTGPALAIDAAHADAIVEAALGGAGFGPGGGGSGGASSRSGGPSGGSPSGTPGSAAGPLAKAKLALLGGAIVVVVIAAIAWRARRGRPQQLALTPDAPELDAGTGTGVAVAPPTRSPDEAQPAADIAQPAPDEVEPAIDPQAETAPTQTARTSQPAEHAEPARTSQPTAEHADPARTSQPARRHGQTDDAADLLGAANAKRAAKEWRASDELYARVVKRAPSSLAAQTALVASASLHLEHLGDPKGAARRFARALAIAPRGALAEDARWGLAEAARALHDTAAEKAALDDFLAHHPSSPLAPRAKARRAQLP